MGCGHGCVMEQAGDFRLFILLTYGTLLLPSQDLTLAFGNPSIFESCIYVEVMSSFHELASANNQCSANTYTVLHATALHTCSCCYGTSPN